MIEYNDFEKVEIRVGTVLEAEDNVKARKPAYVLRIDFGEGIGVKTSSAQLATSYEKGELVGKKVIAVMNFGPKNIAGVVSEVLVLGVPAAGGKTALMEPTAGFEVENGAKLH